MAPNIRNSGGYLINPDDPTGKKKHDEAVDKGKREFLDGIKTEGMIKSGVEVWGKDKDGKPEHKWTGSSPLGALIALIFRGGETPYLKDEGKNVDTTAKGVPIKTVEEKAKKGKVL
jgi:hypothetical protein